jgi:hypothetical protein
VTYRYNLLAMSESKMTSSPTNGRDTRFGAYDKLVRLEQEKRELIRALEQNKKRLMVGMTLLNEKHEQKIKSGQLKLTAAQSVPVMHGYKVEDYRQPVARRKVRKWPTKTDINDLEAEVITDQNMIRIREQNIKNTLCKKKISDILKDKQNREEIAAQREFKKLPPLQRRKMPKISVPPSMLPDRYIRGELPCTIEHGINGHYLSWAAPLDNLDYEYYLPIFFDGLQCKENPSCFLAKQGIEDLLFAARGYPNRIKSCVYSLVRPLRNALSKFDADIMLNVLKALQQLVTCNEGVGATLMPYSKQFLAPIATFMDLSKNTGDGIDYGQRFNNDIGENVRKTLELLEEFGGPDAYKAIKFSIPLYESVMHSKVIDRSGAAGATKAASHAQQMTAKQTNTKLDSRTGASRGSPQNSKPGSQAGSKPGTATLGVGKI